MSDNSVLSTAESPQPANFHSESRLEQLLRETGFPLGSEPTESDLLRAAEQLRRRKRQDLLRFLGRLIARSIRLGSKPGKELCSVNDKV